MKHILESGLFHPDFHLGNILYDKVKRSFVLVDALGVRRAGFLDRQFRAYRMRRVAMELREILSRERMTAFLSACGIPNADAFYDRALDREADALWREWPKRRRQILAGYPKFTRKIEAFCMRSIRCASSGKPSTAKSAKASRRSSRNCSSPIFFCRWR
ncbi:MAG: hypothetical protein V8T86_01230 [Victivallis sp.]